MAPCSCRILRGIVSFLVGSLRMILFFASILLILLTVINVVALHQLTLDYYDDSPTIDFSQFRIYALSLSSLAIALFGAYGSFYENRASLKMFSLLAGLQAALIVGYLFWANCTGYFARQNETLMLNLERDLPRYDWDRVPIDSSSLKATAVWDRVQNGICCGIAGPEDWDRVRPAQVPRDSYPRSCCLDYNYLQDPMRPHPPPDPKPPTSQLCNDPQLLAHIGCGDKLRNNAQVIVWYMVTFAIFQLALAGIACCVRANASLRVEHERQIIAQVTLVRGDGKSVHQQPPPEYMYPDLNGPGYGAI